MPTDEENLQYLYLVLTAGGPPTIDFTEVGKALDLKNGAVTKRWSRLKQAMNEGKSPGPSAYEFLWLLVKHSTREKAPDWADIAAKCSTTAGAASKRYSRMKQAFERGDAAPTSAATKGNAAPDSPAKSTPKRKRAPPKTKGKAANDNDEDVNGKEENVVDATDDGATTSQPKKRARSAAKPRAKPAAKGKDKSKGQEKESEPTAEETTTSVPPTEATTLIKTEGASEYYDQAQYAAGGEVEDTEDGVAQEPEV